MVIFMSKWINRFVAGFLILAVIVSAVTAFRASLLSGGAAYDAFVAIFDCFPFAKEMAELAAIIGQYGITLQGLSPSNFLNDITKIFTMAIVCPILIGFACTIFLKVPDYKDWYDREKYMNGIGYRLKECLLNVIMMPICAYITAKLLDALQAWLQSELPMLGAWTISFVLMVAFFALSVMVAGVSNPISMGMIVKHRLVVDLLGGVLKIIGMNLLCFLIVLAILNDRNNMALGLGVTLVIYLAALDLLISCIMS